MNDYSERNDGEDEMKKVIKFHPFSVNGLHKN